MVIEIKKPVTREKVEEAFSSLREKSGGDKSLRKHFGKLKRGINALEYQKHIRDDWA
jgi:hypothetical protein